MNEIKEILKVGGPGLTPGFFTDLLADAVRAGRTVSLGSGFGITEADNICDKILELYTRSSDPIFLIINSDGGKGRAGLQINNAIKLYAGDIKNDAQEAKKKPLIFALVYGQCNSAAILPLLACSYKLASASSRFFLHGSSINIEPGIIRIEATGDPLEELTKVILDKQDFIKKNDAEILMAITEGTGQSTEEIRKLWGAYLSAFQAKEAKLVDFLM